MLAGLKIGLLLVWAGLFATLFIESDHPLVQWGPWLLLAMAVAHVVEFFIFKSTFAQTRGSMFKHFMSTFLFGGLHYAEVKQIIRQRGEVGNIL